MNNQWITALMEHTRSHYFGLYRGVVTDNEDPTSRARLSVQIPSVLGDLAVWAMPCVPYAGDQEGFLCLPPVGSGVWLMFEGGDPSFPVWMGCFWADNEIPDKSGPSVKIWKTQKVTIKIDDTSGDLSVENPGVTVKATSELEITAGASTHTIGVSAITSESGAAKLEIGPASLRVNSGSLEVI